MKRRWNASACAKAAARCSILPRFRRACKFELEGTLRGARDRNDQMPVIVDLPMRAAARGLADVGARNGLAIQQHLAARRLEAVEAHGIGARPHSPIGAVAALRRDRERHSFLRLLEVQARALEPPFLVVVAGAIVLIELERTLSRTVVRIVGAKAVDIHSQMVERLLARALHNRTKRDD